MVVTYTLIVINFLFYLLQLYNFELFTPLLGLNTLLVSEGFYWQIITNMFVHGSIMHIVMNMAVLYQFGAMIEPLIRKKYFLILYLGGGILTSILSFIVIYNFYPATNTIGASGAIIVLFGWLAHNDTTNRMRLILTILIFTFGFMLLGVNVAWYAHFIGFSIGWVFSLLFKYIDYK